MAEIRVERKQRSLWPWLIALALLALLIWAGVSALGAERGAAERDGTTKVGAAARGKAAPPPPSPRPEATAEQDEQDEALRIRSRVMA